MGQCFIRPNVEKRKLDVEFVGYIYIYIYIYIYLYFMFVSMIYVWWRSILFLKKWNFYFLLFFKIKIMFGSHKVLMKNNKKNIFFKLGFHLMMEKNELVRLPC